MSKVLQIVMKKNEIELLRAIQQEQGWCLADIIVQALRDFIEKQMNT